jgi:arylsulfatase A-like enzyme
MSEPSVEPSRPRRGNVLFITVDQWRGDCLGIDGHPVVETPTIDRLAREGTRFRRHYANAAPCGPSRACLYTGTYLMTNRAVLNGTPLDDRFTNIAREARQLGYDPKLFGYTDSAVDPRGLPLDDPRLFSYEGVLPGFDAVVDLRGERLDVWAAWLATKGYDIPERLSDLYRPADDPDAASHGRTWAPTRYAAEHSETAFLTESLIDWIAGHRAATSDPWFVHASYVRPHPPYIAPAPYHDRYDPASVPMPVQSEGLEADRAQHRFAAAVIGLDGITAPTDERELRQLRATYYGMMTEVDAQLGRLVDWLRSAGELDDTLVVLTSDHGDQMGDHGLIEKLGYWDESYHVPLIVRDPSTPSGSRGRAVDRLTEHVDVLPTILDWMGVEAPLQCDGRSLLDFVRGGEPDAPWRTEVHWQWDFRSPRDHVVEDLYGMTMEQCSLDVIRDDRFKYVHFGAMAPILFDLERDPHQFANVAEHPDYASVRADYAGRLLSWRMRHDERTLTGHYIDTDGLSIRRDPRL